MGGRIDKVNAGLDVYIEFEGHHPLAFSYVPHAGDPLVEAILAKNKQLIEAELAAQPTTMADLFFL